MQDHHGRHHWNRTNILCSSVDNTHSTAHSLMQASTARQTPDDLRPRPSNKDKGLGDSIRDLTWLPELCIPSVIIHNYIVCDMVCLPSYWSAGHMAGFFTGGHYDVRLLREMLTVMPRQAHRGLKLGTWTFDPIPHLHSPHTTMAWTPHHLNLCRRNAQDLPGDFQAHLTTVLEAPTTTPASLSMPPPSSTTKHKRKRHDVGSVTIDTPKVWTTTLASNITLCSINNVVGLSVSGCLSLACNGVYMIDGMLNGRPYFYRYSKDNFSPDNNGSCCYISGEWRLFLNQGAKSYRVASDAYFPPHKGWEINTQTSASCNDTEHPEVITKGTMQLRVGDQVKSLTNWASGRRRVSKGEVGTITGSFERLQQSTGRFATKFRVDYPSVKGLSTWPEQMSYYSKNCPAGNSFLLRMELRAWADAQSKFLDNKPVAETPIIASDSKGRAASPAASTGQCTPAIADE